MVNSSRITFLLSQYADGIISKLDYLELMDLLRLNNDDNEFLIGLDQLTFQELPQGYHDEKEKDLLFQNLLLARSRNKHKKTFSLKVWMSYAAAAIVLVMLSIGIYLYHTFQIGNDALAGNMISPAKDKAYLLLSDGSRINLDSLGEGKKINQNGLSISKSAEGALTYSIAQGGGGNANMENTIITPKGGHYQINLSDGTKVWLNAESKLTFPSKFSRQQRAVRLQGEAYFEVARQPSSVSTVTGQPKRVPFYVLSASQRIEVLGTHFNVNAYADEKNISTTLLEGAVSLSIMDAKGGISTSSVLKPGQQGVSNGSSIKVSNVDTEEFMGWKNGLFLFNNESLATIMKEVSRWYDVEVVFENESLKYNKFSGSTSRFKNISALLEVLESTGSVHFKIEGRRILVKE